MHARGLNSGVCLGSFRGSAGGGTMHAAAERAARGTDVRLYVLEPLYAAASRVPEGGVDLVPLQA